MPPTSTTPDPSSLPQGIEKRRDPARPQPLEDARVDILDVQVLNPPPVALKSLCRVAATDGVMAGVDAEPEKLRVGRRHQALDLAGSLDIRTYVGVIDHQVVPFARLGGESMQHFDGALEPPRGQPGGDWTVRSSGSLRAPGRQMVGEDQYLAAVLLEIANLAPAELHRCFGWTVGGTGEDRVHLSDTQPAPAQLLSEPVPAWEHARQLQALEAQPRYLIKEGHTVDWWGEVGQVVVGKRERNDSYRAAQRIPRGAPGLGHSGGGPPVGGRTPQHRPHPQPEPPDISTSRRLNASACAPIISRTPSGDGLRSRWATRTPVAGRPPAA